MFPKTPDEKPDLQSTIDELILEMKSVNADSKEYDAMSNQLVKLYKLKEVDFQSKISKDVLVSALVHLIGIMLITNFEKNNVITTKAIQFFRDFKS